MERSILDAIEAAAERGEQAAVATVVSTFGSAPRQPGAKYVVTEGGRYVGSVSGGCVESDVAERAQKVFAGERANLIHYGVSDDDAFEVGLSCGGKIDVWLERADPALWSEVRVAARRRRVRDALHEHRDRREAARAAACSRARAFATTASSPRWSKARCACSSSAPPRPPSISARTASSSAGTRRSSTRAPALVTRRAAPERRRDRQGLARRGARPHRRAHRRRHALARGAARHSGDRRRARARRPLHRRDRREADGRSAAAQRSLEQGFSDAEIDRIHGPPGSISAAAPGAGRARDRGRDRRGDLRRREEGQGRVRGRLGPERLTKRGRGLDACRGALRRRRREEAVLGPGELPHLGRHAGLPQTLRVRLALLRQRVELSGDHERRRQAAEVGRPQR